MFLPERDRQIVLAVGRFGQLATGHVRALFFKELASTTPCDRALQRLVKRRFLARIERRLVGGTGAGSGQYVYQLGPLGWGVCRKETRYWPYRAVNPHMLAVADAYVAINDLPDRYEVTALQTEPDTWVELAGTELRPDLHVELADHERRQTYSWWLEVDMGTERQKQMKDKLARYWHVWEHVDNISMPTFPLVIFLVPDVEREVWLRNIIRQGSSEAQALFKVMLLSDFPRRLLL